MIQENGWFRVSSSVHGNEGNVKRITVPPFCTIGELHARLCHLRFPSGDLSSALMQIHGIGKNRSASTVRLFVHSTIDGISNRQRSATSTLKHLGKSKYDELQVKSLSKKPVGEAKIRDSTHLVFDLDNTL